MEGQGFHPRTNDVEEAAACAAKYMSSPTTPRHCVLECGACPAQVCLSNLVLIEEYFVSRMAPKQKNLDDCEVEEVICNPARNSAASEMSITVTYDFPAGMVPAEDLSMSEDKDVISTSQLICAATPAPTNMVATSHDGKKADLHNDGATSLQMLFPLSPRGMPTSKPSCIHSFSPILKDSSLADDVGSGATSLKMLFPLSPRGVPTSKPSCIHSFSPILKDSSLADDVGSGATSLKMLFPLSPRGVPTSKPSCIHSFSPILTDSSLADDVGMDVAGLKAGAAFNIAMNAKWHELEQMLPAVDSRLKQYFEATRTKKRSMYQQHAARTLSAVQEAQLSHQTTVATPPWQPLELPFPLSPRSPPATPPVLSPQCSYDASTPDVPQHAPFDPHHEPAAAGSKLSSAATSPSCWAQLSVDAPVTATRRAPTVASLRSTWDSLEKLKPQMDTSVQHKVASLRAELKARRARHAASHMPVRQLDVDLASPKSVKAEQTSTTPVSPPHFPTSCPSSASADQPSESSTSASDLSDYDTALEICDKIMSTSFNADPRDLIRSLQGSPLQPRDMTGFMAPSSNKIDTSDSNNIDDTINCIADNHSNIDCCFTATNTCTDDDLEACLEACDTHDEHLSMRSSSSSDLHRGASTISDAFDACKSFALVIEQQGIDCDLIVPRKDKPASRKAKGIKACWKAFASTCGKAARAVKKVAKGACSCLAPSQ